jgi:hypothetical protein
MTRNKTAAMLHLKNIALFSQVDGKSHIVPNTKFGLESFFDEYGADGYTRLLTILTELKFEIDHAYTQSLT